MCGLFGFAGKLATEKRRALLRALCAMNSSRGTDSVGLARINRNSSKPQIYKTLAHPMNAINHRAYVEICDDQGNVWIGHTRMKTRGEVNVNNAHPFHIGQTVMAHNGMVTVDKSLIDRCDGIDYPVDSQYLAHLLEHNNGKIGPISGTAALAFSQLKSAVDVSLVRWRNPLTVAKIHGSNGIAWSSDINHLRFALAIAGIQRYEFVASKDFPDCTRWDFYIGADGRIADAIESPVGIENVPYTYSGGLGFRPNSWDHLEDSYDVHYTSNGKHYYQKRKHQGRIAYRQQSGQVCGMPNKPQTTDDSKAYGDALQRMAMEERTALAAEYGDAIAELTVDSSGDASPDATGWGLPGDVDIDSARLPRELR